MLPGMPKEPAAADVEDELPTDVEDAMISWAWLNRADVFEDEDEPAGHDPDSPHKP